MLTSAHLDSEGLPEVAEPPGEKEGLIKDSAIEVPVKSGLEPKSDLMSGITAAFNTFKTQLEDQFAVSTHTYRFIISDLPESQNTPDILFPGLLAIR